MFFPWFGYDDLFCFWVQLAILNPENEVCQPPPEGVVVASSKLYKDCVACLEMQDGVCHALVVLHTGSPSIGDLDPIVDQIEISVVSVSSMGHHLKNILLLIISVALIFKKFGYENPFV